MWACFFIEVLLQLFADNNRPLAAKKAASAAISGKRVARVFKSGMAAVSVFEIGQPGLSAIASATSADRRPY